MLWNIWLCILVFIMSWFWWFLCKPTVVDILINVYNYVQELWHYNDWYFSVPLLQKGYESLTVCHCSSACRIFVLSRFCRWYLLLKIYVTMCLLVSTAFHTVLTLKRQRSRNWWIMSGFSLNCLLDWFSSCHSNIALLCNLLYLQCIDFCTCCLCDLLLIILTPLIFRLLNASMIVHYLLFVCSCEYVVDAFYNRVFLLHAMGASEIIMHI